jgi:hypothetical protein
VQSNPPSGCLSRQSKRALDGPHDLSSFEFMDVDGLNGHWPRHVALLAYFIAAAVAKMHDRARAIAAYHREDWLTEQRYPLLFDTRSLNKGRSRCLNHAQPRGVEF